jgi:hypothetical protein
MEERIKRANGALEFFEGVNYEKWGRKFTIN